MLTTSSFILVSPFPWSHLPTLMATQSLSIRTFRHTPCPDSPPKFGRRTELVIFPAHSTSPLSHNCGLPTRRQRPYELDSLDEA